MHTALRIPLIFGCAFIFSLLFLDAYPGINWLLFILILIVAAYSINPIQVSKTRILASGGLLISSMSFVVNGSFWGFFVSLIWLAAFAGITTQPYYRSLVTTYFQAVSNVIMSYVNFIRALFDQKLGLGNYLKRSLRYYYMAIPVAIILVFITIYSHANPFFEEYMGVISSAVSESLSWIASHVNVRWFWLLVLGLVLSIYALMPYRSESLMNWENQQKLVIERVRSGFPQAFSILGLLNEYRAAIGLMVSLNLVLLFFNALDIIHVWVNFEWNGEYLKQFVHEGTWLLIVSIVISMLLVLYYFRGNLNFFPKRKWLVRLTAIWLVQNAFLALSVLVRNLHYIEHFNLAYKRIAVIFFLALVLFGLYTVFIKITRRKSMFYLFSQNAIALLVVLLLSTTVNWDVFIARYNLAHSRTAYVHFDFLAKMNFSAIPYIDLQLHELQEIEEVRNARFPVEPSYMSAVEFYNHLQQKKAIFFENYQEQSWKQWNYADASAYEYLKVKEQLALAPPN